MAIWQTWFSLNNNQRKIILQDEQLKCVTELSLRFPEKTSWSKNIRQFGDLDSTCIEFIYENIELSKDICEISVRLDLRSINMEELQTICIFACENNLLVGIDDTFYEPTISVLIDIIKRSHAYKFITNPKLFLDSITPYIDTDHTPHNSF